MTSATPGEIGSLIILEDGQVSTTSFSGYLLNPGDGYPIIWAYGLGMRKRGGCGYQVPFLLQPGSIGRFISGVSVGVPGCSKIGSGTAIQDLMDRTSPFTPHWTIDRAMIHPTRKVNTGRFIG